MTIQNTRRTYAYYLDILKNRAHRITSPIVGDSADISSEYTVYDYQGSTNYSLSSFFTPQTPVTIILVSGSLTISSSFSLNPSQSVVFITQGDITIDGDITTIPGLYMTDTVFRVASGPDPITIEGMVYAQSLSLNRTFQSDTQPTYQFVYQPKYLIHLLPYMGKQQVRWRE